MHLRLRTAISPLSGPEFGYHHVTQAETTRSHEQHIYPVICKYTTAVTATMEAAMDNLLAPVQDLFEGQIVSPLPVSARRKTSHDRPLVC